jgi:hypothetical protein
MLLCDFEDESALKAWEVTAGTPALVAEGATHGAHALQITFDPRGQYHGAYLLWRQPPRDWSHYDALVLDVFNPTSAPVSGYVLVADSAWQQTGRSYWNRHNGLTAFAPGHSQWVIPVRGLYRGEAGSRRPNTAVVKVTEEGPAGRKKDADVTAARPDGKDRLGGADDRKIDLTTVADFLLRAGVVATVPSS